MSTRGQETNDDQVDPSTKLSTSKDSQKSKKFRLDWDTALKAKEKEIRSNNVDTPSIGDMTEREISQSLSDKSDPYQVEVDYTGMNPTQSNKSKINQTTTQTRLIVLSSQFRLQASRLWIETTQYLNRCYR